MKKSKFSPILIFIFLWIIVLIFSYILRDTSFYLETQDKNYVIENLLNHSGIEWILSNVVKNFSNFNVLPIVLIVVLGIGIAEETKYLELVLKQLIIKIPKYLITPLLLLLGIIGNLAGSASFAIVPSLGAIMFKIANKNPLLGIITGFIGVAGGLSANIFISTTDVISSSITQNAARIVDKNFNVLPTSNWYFFAVSTILLMLVGTLVIEYIVSPMVNKYEVINFQEEIVDLSKNEKKGIFYANISLLGYLLILILLFIPKNGILRGVDGDLINSTLIKGIIPIITLLFMIPAIVFGKHIKLINNFNDFIDLLNKSISKYSNFIVLCFFASQFIGIFKKSNIGLYFSYLGIKLISKFNLNIYVFIILFIVFSMILNIFIGSMSAKWIIMAPIFIPLFINLGFTPAFGQLVFRIADSVTNPISPLEPFVPFILATMNKYNKDIGFYELFKFMFPLSISFLIVWLIQLFICILFNFNIGPSTSIFI